MCRKASSFHQFLLSIILHCLFSFPEIIWMWRKEVVVWRNRKHSKQKKVTEMPESSSNYLQQIQNFLRVTLNRARSLGQQSWRRIRCRRKRSVPAHNGGGPGRPSSPIPQECSRPALCEHFVFVFFFFSIFFLFFN